MPAAPDLVPRLDIEILLDYALQDKALAQLRDPVATPMDLKGGWHALPEAVPGAVKMFEDGHPELLTWLRKMSTEHKALKKSKNSKKGAKTVGAAAAGGGGGGGAGEYSEGSGGGGFSEGGGEGSGVAQATAEEVLRGDPIWAHLQGFKKAMKKLETALGVV